jgi:putative RecB family exonuclease
MATYSHSKLACFETCPKKYFYKYIERPEVERIETIEAFLGCRVHEALEKLYRDVKMQKETSESDLIAYYNERWLKNWHENVTVVNPNYSAEHYRKVGEKCLHDYYKRYYPFDDSITLCLEEMVLFTLDEDRDYKVRGYIDRLARREDGTYEIHDYKTSLAKLPMQEALNEDRQLALYEIGIRNRFEDAEPENTELVWHYLAFDTELRSRRTKEQLEQLKNETISLINTIERAEHEQEFPAKESKLCAWCEYQAVCPMQKHTFETAKLKANEYLKEEGVVLVNKLVQLKAQAKKIEEEINKVKEALYEYAKRKDVEIVQGSDYKARIKVEKKPKLPAKHDPERALLEKVVKEHNLWEKVSELNTFRLLKLLESKTLPEHVIKQIRKFERLEEDRRIYISKAKSLFE